MISTMDKIKSLQEQLRITDKALALIQIKMSKSKLAEELGISRPTLDSRLDNVSKWKKLEKNWIGKLYEDI